MIYLIHIDPPIGRSRHYLGWCNDTRLKDRLREHARGHGATLTREAVRRKSKLWLTRTFPDGNVMLERAMKTRGDYRRLCPLCCPMFAHLKNGAYEIDANRPEQPPARAILDWRPRQEVPSPPE